MMTFTQSYCGLTSLHIYLGSINISTEMIFMIHALEAMRFFFVGSVPMYELPLTGGAGPMVVTAIGIGLAILSLLLFILRGKSNDKPKSQDKRPRR